MSRKRVLLLDDDWIILLMARDALEDAHYRVFPLDRSTHVPDALRAVQPDILVLDIRMPGLTGLQVVGELAGLGIEVPLIIISALDPDGTRSLGGHAYLPKPFLPEKLVALVARIIGRSPEDEEYP